MPLCAVQGDPNTDVGGELIAANPQTVFINSIPVIDHGPDPAQPDALCPFDGHCNPETAEGSPTVYYYNKPVHRMLDARSCGATTIVELQQTVFANEPEINMGENMTTPGVIIIQGRTVYEDTPQGWAAQAVAAAKVDPAINSYHEEPLSITRSLEPQKQDSEAKPPTSCVNSKYFNLSDAKMQIVGQNGYTKEQIECNWIALCEYILDNLRDDGYSFSFNSGFRTIGYDSSVGSGVGDHTIGCAADISTGSKEGNKKLFKHMLNNPKYPYSQLIFEGNWIHVAYNGKGPKGAARVMYTYNGKSPVVAGARGENLPSDLRTA